MNKIKSLASQTALYGIPTIVGRLLNYFLVPLHTLIFSPQEFAPVAYFYAFVALLLIVFTHGMETTFFRFSSDSRTDKPKYYNYAFTSVLAVSGIVTIILILASDGLASMADYTGQGQIVRWLAAILFMDAVVSIPFAQMRLENKARKFAITKMVNIILNILFQLFFLLLLPKMAVSENSIFYDLASSIYNPDLGIGYIFLANLLANVAMVAILWPYFSKVRLRLDSTSFKKMLAYSTPLLLTGVAGWFSEQFDKVLIRGFMSETDLGVYAQTFKLALLIQLAVQAFRYAGEPFFFSNAKDKEAPQLFADVLYYFVIFAMIIFVCIGLNVDWIAELMLRRPEYRTALYIVPIIMMGKIFFGIYMNISMWFKIKDKTIYGTYFTVLGAVISILGNTLLIPVLGITGSAITVLLVYSSMTIVCYRVGRNHFRVPYPIQSIGTYLITGSIIVWASFQIRLDNSLLDAGFNILMALIYCLTVWFIERRKLAAKSL